MKAGLRTFSWVLSAVTAVACSSGSSTNAGDDAAVGDAAAADGASESAASEGGGDGASCSGTMQSGTVLCSRVLGALCMRRVSCKPNTCMCPDCADVAHEQCTPPGGCSSGSPPCTQQTCAQAMASDAKGYDCTQPKFANKMLCDSVTTACTGDLPLVACTDSQQNTWNWPSTCVAFWSLFP